MRHNTNPLGYLILSLIALTLVFLGLLGLWMSGVN